MSHIEINTDDLTLLSNDINAIKTKITSLKETINSKFGAVKDLNFYEAGFNNINSYLEQELTTLTEVKTKIEKYQNDVMGVENSFSEKFNNINVPNITSNASSLAVVSPAAFAQSTTPPTNNSFFQSTDTTGSEKKEEKQASSNNAESSSGGSNVLGVLAGAAGIIGAAGLGTAAYMKSKEKEDEEEKKESTPVSFSDVKEY